MTVSVIPAPRDLRLASGSIDVSSLTAVTVADPDALGVAEGFRADLKGWTGLVLPPARHTPERVDGDIRLVPDAAPAGADAAPGAHTVTVDAGGIVVSAATPEGLSRGLVTVLQLIGTAEGGAAARIPALTLSDAPRWAWRGLSLDTVRHFVPLAEIKRVIDVLALYKFSVLHLHLTNNEGWRVQIPSWPLLTPEPASGPREFFTLDEIAELARYAAERFVCLVPEVNVPGHVAAALRAYPELNPSAGDTLTGILPTAYLDKDSESAWCFLSDVITTLAEVTPGPFLHIGGDEAFGMPDAEYARFVTEAVRLAEAAGKRTIGFQETSRADIGPGHTAQYWIDFTFTAPDPDEVREGGVPRETLELVAQNFVHAQQDGARIIEKGAHAILSPSTRAYLDRPQGESSLDGGQEQTRSRLGMQFYPATPLRDYLEWDPRQIIPGLDEDRIAGVEAALWGETITSVDDLESLLLPRLTATGEVGWSGTGEESWTAHRERVAAHARMWDRRGWNWYQTDAIGWQR